MKKFFEFMEKYFVPVAAKIGGQRHLVAIRDGFVTITPLIIAGSFAVLINNLGFKWYQNLMNSFLPANWKDFGGSIWNASFGVMSLLVVCTISYHLARSYDKDGMSSAMVSLGSLIILYTLNPDGTMPMTYLGGSGLFVAIIVAIVATEIFTRLLGNPKLVIKMPNGVPPAVAKSFAALFPSIIVLVIAAAVKYIFVGFGVTNIHESLFMLIQKPLQGALSSYPGLMILVFMQQLLWFFGLHGSNILAPVINAVLLPLTEANMHAAQQGLTPEFIVNSQFLDSFVNMGGSGVTIALLIAIFLVGRKSKTQMMIAKLGTAPGCFNINEPVIFGMPLVLNPIYFIPFIIAPMVTGTIAYFLTFIGFVPKVTIMANWTMPPVFGAFLSTNSLMGALTALICIAVAVLIYIPFVMIATREELKLEQSQNN
ncbi:PTS sugar transporter subunit IIC [Clostridium perfringens]|nr:PTS sugar transporter subunit IIC [Clostridium perfringens]